MKRHKFIIVEGMDGTGKSTVVRQLAQVIGARAVSSVPTVLDPLRPWVDASASLETRYAFYRFAVSSMADEVDRLLRHQPVVCDRWIYSTLAYHAALGLGVDEDEVGGLASMPDHAFLLTAPSATRSTRINARSANSHADRLFLDPALGADVAARLVRLGLHRVDTESIDVAGVVSLLVAQIGEPHTFDARPLRNRWDAGSAQGLLLSHAAAQPVRLFS